MKPNRTFQNIYSKIHKHVWDIEWDCLSNGCTKKSINSHLIQQRGILNTLTDNGHLYELKSVDVFKMKYDEAPFEFKKIGIRNAISYPLFCNECDTKIFKDIETEPIDFTKYRSNILLSYRALCAELRKKQRTIEIYTRMHNSNILQNQFNDEQKEDNESLLKGTELGIKDLKKYKLILESEITNGTNTFTFKVLKYNLIKIYGSAIFTPIYPTTKADQEEPFNTIFIHILPYNNALYIIIGYHNSFKDTWIIDYVKSWENLTKEKLEIKLTDLFTVHIESWGLSPSLFEKIPTDRINALKKHWNKGMNYASQQPVNFNLFS